MNKHSSLPVFTMSYSPVMNTDKEDEQSVPLTHSTDDDNESDFGSQSSATPFNGRPIRRRRNACRAYLCTILGYTLCAAVFTFIGAQIARGNLDLDGRCAAHTTQYSPLLKDVKVKYAMKEFNGTFMEEDVFRQAASPEVDAAWGSLGVDYRPGIIPQSEGEASGLGPQHVQINPKYGGGFIVNVEGMHHLHCLNLVRKSLYFNYDYYKAMGHHAFSNDDRILHLHVTHCLDTIRQVLMCNADTGVLGQVWSDAHGGEHGAINPGETHPSHTVGDHAPIDEGHDHDSHSDESHTRRRRNLTPLGRLNRRHGDEDEEQSSPSSHDSGSATPPPKANSNGKDQHYPSAFPDFHTQHKCKNYDAIRKWAESIQAPPNDKLPPDFLSKPIPEYVVQGTP